MTRVPTESAARTAVASPCGAGIGSNCPTKEGAMAGIEAKSFDSPDETRQFQGHGRAEVVEMQGKTVLRSVFEPGWHWKDDVGPIAGTDSCQTHHFGYMVSG